MKDKLYIIIFLIILFGFSIANILVPDKKISNYERRNLMQSYKLKEDFVSNLDDYISDQFVFRDSFISLNTTINRYVFGKKDTNNVYIVGDYVIEKNYPLDEKSVFNYIKKINYINNKYLSNSNVYYTIIPDKSYFLEDKYLKIDYDRLYKLVNSSVQGKYINVRDLFTLDDYYKTDIHIKQENYNDFIKLTINKMGKNYYDITYKVNKYDDFKGASYSKIPSFMKTDELIYLNNNILENSDVWHLEYDNKEIYDISKLGGVDSYNVYLSGPSSLIEIYNNNSIYDDELVIFRDSFGSSFSPLLVPYYKKITLIDLRYINMDIVSNYVNFDNKDVLFAYSTLIINNSNILKININ